MTGLVTDFKQAEGFFTQSTTQIIYKVVDGEERETEGKVRSLRWVREELPHSPYCFSSVAGNTASN